MLISLLEQTSQMLTEINFEKTKNQFFKKLVTRVIEDDTFWDEYNRRVERDKRVGETDEFSEIDRLRLFQYAYYRICSMDPTNERPNNPNAYTLWLIQKYVSGGIKLWEDLSTAKELLASYDVYKIRKVFQRAPGGKRYSDIGTVKSIADLFDAVKLARTWLNELDVSALADKFAAYMEWQKKDGIRIVFPKVNLDDAEAVKEAFNKYVGMGAVFELLTVEASVDLFQKDTAWCTARDGNRYFDSYHEDGPLFVIDDVKGDHLYQVHMASEQFLDERDRIPEDWLTIPINLLQQLPYPLADVLQEARGGGFKTELFNAMVDGLTQGHDPVTLFQRLIPETTRPPVPIDYADLVQAYQLYWQLYSKCPPVNLVEAWFDSEPHNESIGDSILIGFAYRARYPATPEVKKWALDKYVENYIQLEHLDNWTVHGVGTSTHADILETFKHRVLTDSTYLSEFLTYAKSARKPFEQLKEALSFTQQEVDTLFNQLPPEVYAHGDTAFIPNQLMHFLNPPFRKEDRNPMPDKDALKHCITQFAKGAASDTRILSEMCYLYDILLRSETASNYADIIDLDPVVRASEQYGVDSDLSARAGELLIHLLTLTPESTIRIFAVPRVLNAVAWEDHLKFYHTDRGLMALMSDPTLAGRVRKAFIHRMSERPFLMSKMIQTITRIPELINVVNTAFVTTVAGMLQHDRDQLFSFVINHMAAWINPQYFSPPAKVNNKTATSYMNEALLYIVSLIDNIPVSYGTSSTIRKIDQLVDFMVTWKYPVDPRVYVNIAKIEGGLIWLAQHREKFEHTYPRAIIRLINYEEFWRKPDGSFNWEGPKLDQIIHFLDAANNPLTK